MSFVVKKVDDACWSVGAGYYSPKLVAVARQVPGVVRSGRHAVGYVDGIETVVAMLRAIGLRVDDEAIGRSGGPADYSHNLPASYELTRDYQKTGIDFLIARGPTGALLADDMSLGKGHQSLRAARAFRAKTLVICPNHVRGVWEREPSKLITDKGEIYKWWPEAGKAGVQSLRSLTPSKLDPNALIAVIHYDIVHAWVDVLIEWGVRTIILDEGHVVQGADSRRAKAIRLIARECRVRIALTGTPPTDYPKDFHNLLDILSPDRFGDFFGFGRRYCNGHKIDVQTRGGIVQSVWDFKGKSNTDELGKRVEWMMLRRLKSDVAREMPAKNREIIDVSIKVNALSKVGHFDVKKSVAMRKALDYAADSKLPFTLSLVETDLRQNNKIICFTYRREIAEAIAKEMLKKGFPVEYIHGGVSHGNRSKRIDRIKQVSGRALLIGTIDVCGSGIDFSWANLGIFAELVWRPREILQAEDRLHRIGITMPITLKYIIARGTADELILAGVIRKLNNRDALLGKGDDHLVEDLSAQKSDDELLKELADDLRGMV